MIPFEQIQYLLPEIVLLVGILIYTIIGSLLSEKRQREQLPYLMLAIVGAAIYFSVSLLSVERQVLFSGAVVIDYLALITKTLLSSMVLIATLFISNNIQGNRVRYFEFTLLVQLSLLGAFVLISAAQLLTAYLGFELLSLSFYGLVALQRDEAEKTEAAMKYFIIGALASGIMLYGIALLYGYTGSLEYQAIADTLNQSLEHGLMVVVASTLIFTAIAFKVGLFPFHQWMPDLYKGANNATVTYIAIIPKAAAILFLIRLLSEMLPSLLESNSYYFALIGISSIIFGNTVAMVQTNLKRLLAYSTVAQMGYLVLAFIGTYPNYEYALFYLYSYLATTVLIFSLLLTLNSSCPNIQYISQLVGLAKRSKIQALLFLCTFFSLAGIPPFIGFYAKFNVISHLVSHELYAMSVLALVFSVIGAFYYLSLVKTIYLESDENSSKKILLGNYQLFLLSILIIGFMSLSLFPNLLYQIVKYS